MGNKSSTAALAPTPTFPLAAALATESFDVRPLRGFASYNSALRLRLESETLSLLNDADVVVVSFPYHRILCWGYTATTFSFRVCPSLDDVVDTESAATLTHETLTGVGGGAEEAAASTASFLVESSDGPALEAALMRAVQRLMSAMRARGVETSEFDALTAVLPALVADGSTEHALQSLKQMTLGRAFDARQAVTLLNVFGKVSPFEKVEAACALWPDALIHKESLGTVLDEAFDNDQDRDNGLHRLGLVVSAEGALMLVPTAASRAAAAAGRR